jgi:hypothetical protein
MSTRSDHLPIGRRTRPAALVALLLALTGCSGDPRDEDPGDGEDGPPPEDPGPPSPYDVVVDVPASGGYGEHTFRLPARTNWANTGLFLRAGETASVTASGTWVFEGTEVGPNGLDGVDVDGCPAGMLVARTGLHWADPRACIGEDGVFTAERDGILYVSANVADDLFEGYEQRRLSADGEIDVQVASEGDTSPSIWIGDLADTDLSTIDSGWVEIRGRHVLVTIDTESAARDVETASDAIGTLDAIYDEHVELRDLLPSFGQRIRFFPDPDIVEIGYMLAGNPVRCDPDIMNGVPTQRILRAGEPKTDIWGFAHELGHDFTFSNGTWAYMFPNLESWPNIFTVHALRGLDRTEFQPNSWTYCDGRDAYLDQPDYATFRDDPFVQLCFLLEVGKTHGGWAFWTSFFALLDPLTNGDIVLDPEDPEDRLLWGWIRDRFSEAAGTDVTPLFEEWAVPLPL